MDPITAALIGILLLIVIGGVWGLTIISGIMERRLREAEGRGVDAAQLDALRTDYAQLEGRLGQLEEEMEFLRALREPEPRSELPRVEDAEG